MQNVTKYSFMEQERPVLKASITGKEGNVALRGTIYGYELPNGIYLQGDIYGLLKSSDFAFHVHEGLLCDKHGEIMSDADGIASAQIYLDRSNTTRIAGRPIVLHLKEDGKETEIACGLLSRVL